MDEPSRPGSAVFARPAAPLFRRQCSRVTRGGAGTKARHIGASRAWVGRESQAAQPCGHSQDSAQGQAITSALPACGSRVSTFGAALVRKRDARMRVYCGGSGNVEPLLPETTDLFRHGRRKVDRVTERECSGSGTTAKPASGSLSRLRCGAHALDACGEHLRSTARKRPWRWPCMLPGA